MHTTVNAKAAPAPVMTRLCNHYVTGCTTGTRPKWGGGDYLHNYHCAFFSNRILSAETKTDPKMDPEDF